MEVLRFHTQLQRRGPAAAVMGRRSAAEIFLVGAFAGRAG